MPVTPCPPALRIATPALTLGLLCASLGPLGCAAKGTSSGGDGSVDRHADADPVADASEMDRPGDGGGDTPAGTGGAVGPRGSGGSTGTPDGGGTGGSAASTGGAPASTGGNGSGGAMTASGGRGGAGAGGSVAGAAGGIGGAATAGAGGHGGFSSSGGAPSGAGGCPGLICEDFESGAVDANKWDTVIKTGTMAIQSQQVAHGKYAARFTGVGAQSDDWALLVAKSVPAALKAGSTVFGRAYVYFPAEATSSIHIQLAFAGKNGMGTSSTGPAPFPKLRYLEIASYSGVWQQGFDLLDISPSVEEVSYSKNHLPTNKWVCVEWQLNDAPDAVTVWLAGAQVATFDNTNVSYASPGPIPKPGAPLYDGSSSGLVGGFDTFGFGFHDWHPQKAFDLYYDDVVLDVKRPGCLDQP